MDDLIRRLAAIDAVRTYLTDCQVEDADSHGNGIEHELNNLPPAQPERPRWIPCAERTPTRNDHKDGMVLVCYDTGLIRFGAYIDGEWVTGEPIAWMPLPEPYEEEQDEQGAG